MIRHRTVTLTQARDARGRFTEWHEAPGADIGALDIRAAIVHLFPVGLLILAVALGTQL